MAASEAAPEMEKIDWWSGRAKQTQSRPKHSLFGTNMEAVDRSELEKMEGRYIPEGYVRPQKNRYPLPDHMQSALTAKNVLENCKREVQQHKDTVSEIDSGMSNKAMEAFTFRTPRKQLANQSAGTSSRPAWLTKEALQHSKDINIVGLNERGSYNRDKYGHKAKRHNYSLIGDIMAKNMDFKSPRTELNSASEEAFSEYKVGRRHKREKLPNNINDLPKQDNKSQSLVNLPANIRHMFGSRICDSLLSDKELVDQAKERQKVRSGPPRPSRQVDVESLPVDVKKDLVSMRSNMFPGLSSDNTISRTQDDFNDTVHLRRVPNTDEFRYVRDELSIWVEQDVLRQRQQHKWTNYFSNLKKFDANWDRNATRSAPQPVKQVPKAKPKQKPKPKPAAAPEPQEAEPEFVFVTPPLTPPLAPHPEYVDMSKNVEKDEEFWKFFDQPIGKS